MERCIVVTDDRGRPTGRGVVEFASKAAARKALESCTEGALLLTAYVFSAVIILTLHDKLFKVAKTKQPICVRVHAIQTELESLFSLYGVGQKIEHVYAPLPSTPCPAIVEPTEHFDDEEGLPENMLSITPKYLK